MPVDPQARTVLTALETIGGPDITTLSASEARQLSALPPPAEVEAVAHVEDRSVPGPAGEIPVRVYRPEGSGPFPTLVYFHGGGFVMCSLDTHDNVCRSLTNRANCVVVSVDYRLAPEGKYPSAPEDCYAATCWVAERGAEIGADPERVAIGGDSAGGNLTAVVALMSRDRGGPSLRHQLLVYPVTDHAFDTPSYADNAEGYMLSRAMMKWFWGHYLNDASEGEDAYASPLRAKDLSGLPPALVITAEFDPLRDEGERYAARLREAGVDVTLTRYDGMIHGFFSMAALIDRGDEALREAAAALRASFA